MKQHVSSKRTSPGQAQSKQLASHKQGWPLAQQQQRSNRHHHRCAAELSYKSSGVDIDAGNELVQRIKKINPDIGGFSGMFPFGAHVPQLRITAVQQRCSPECVSAGRSPSVHITAQAIFTLFSGD